jgi:hypothetical protein
MRDCCFWRMGALTAPLLNCIMTNQRSSPRFSDNCHYSGSNASQKCRTHEQLILGPSPQRSLRTNLDEPMKSLKKSGNFKLCRKTVGRFHVMPTKFHLCRNRSRKLLIPVIAEFHLMTEPTECVCQNDSFECSACSN